MPGPKLSEFSSLCLALPAAFTQPGSRLLAERSSICSVDASYGTFGGGETETVEAPRKCSRVSAGMAFESDERASALASCRRAVEENADSFTGMLGRYVWALNQHHWSMVWLNRMLHRK